MKPRRTRQASIAANAAGPPLSPLPQYRGRLTAMWRVVLMAIVAGYLAFATTHALRTPVGSSGYQDAPDEAAHVNAILVVASGRLPTRDRPGVTPADSAASYEWHQPPLYYALCAPLIRGGVKTVRLFSVAIGLACILAIYAGGRVLAPDHPELAVLAAGVAALLPGHAAISSVVNNDGLLELLFTVVLTLALRLVMHGPSPRLSAALGLALGAALLTKATAVLLIPAVLLALGFVWRNGESPRAVARAAGILGTVALLACGWWFARNALLYHEWLPLTAFRESFRGTAKAADVVSGRLGLHVDGWAGYALLVTQWTFQSFIGVYSTPQGARWGVPTFLPAQVYAIALLVAVTAAGGALRMSMFRTRLSREQAQGVGLMLTVAGLVCASFAAFASQYFQAQGRYLYPAMFPLAMLMALGWRGAFPRRYADAAGVSLLALLAVFSLAFVQATG